LRQNSTEIPLYVELSRIAPEEEEEEEDDKSDQVRTKLESIAREQSHCPITTTTTVDGS